MDTKAAWAARKAHWREYELWRRNEERPVERTPEEATRWANDVLDHVVREHGMPRPDQTGEGIIELHRRLVHLPNR